MNIYEQIKASIHQQTTEVLKEMYRDVCAQGTEIETLLVRGALEGELEERGVLHFNEEAFEYEWI